MHYSASVNSALPPPESDADAIVDPSNGASIAYWASRLMLSESTLCVMMSQFGPRVLDLKQVILNLADDGNDEPVD